MEGFGYEFTWGAIKALVLALILASIVLAGINAVMRHFRIGYDETDNRETGERSGLKVYTDHATGCQYIATSNGNLTPRLGPDGDAICEKVSS